MSYLIAGVAMLVLAIYLIYSGSQNAKNTITTQKQDDICTNSDGKVICPKCGSVQIQIVKRGWKITTGFIGSSRNERVCMRCKHKF